MADRTRWLRSWRCVAALLAALASIAVAGAGSAKAAGMSAVLVVDANSGRVLHQSAADEPRHPASLAKMMTIYLAFELIEQGRLSYQTKIKFSANAVVATPSKLDLAEGEEITLIDALKILITKSANDVAIAVAEHIAGSEERFARLMTQKARLLGMAATTFRNASGLPDPQQITTARDIVTLALRLQDDFPRHYRLFATRTASYKDETFRNHNTLLFHYPGTDGLKTGYTRASGFNLVASVRRGRKHVIGAVFGGASAASRNAAMRTFLNMGLVKASNERTRQPTAGLVAQARSPALDRRIGPVPKPHRVPRSSVATGPSPADPPVAQYRPASPAIEMARVRSVLVGPSAPGAAADEPYESERRPTTPPLSAWTTSSTLAPPAHPPAAPADRPALFSNPVIVRGASPSTLDEQAANLARGGPALIVPDRAPAVAATAAPSNSEGAFQIQIGAFQSEAEAARHLAIVGERAAAFVAGSSPVMLQAQQGKKAIYRARYSGFDARAAARVCGELKLLKIDCIVVRAE